MNSKSDTGKTPKSAASRDDRLKAALKANMAKRKAQAKARKSTADTQSDGGQDS